MSVVSFQIELVLEFFHPLGEFVSEVLQGVFEVSDSLNKSVESLLADTAARRLWNSQIGKGFLEFEEFLFKS